MSVLVDRNTRVIVQRMGKATPQSLYTLGDIYANEGLVDLAARAYRNAIDGDPSQPPARPLRCVDIVAQRGGTIQAKDLAGHIRSVMGATLDDTDKKKLLKIEARIAVAEGGGSEAVKTLEEIVALDPLDGEAILLLAQHYTKANDPGKAIFYYERAEGIETFEADARLRHAQILVGQSRFQDAVPLLKRPALVTSRRSETSPSGAGYRTVYFFQLEFADGCSGEFRYPGRGVNHDLLVSGNTGVAFTRGDLLVDFLPIRV